MPLQTQSASNLPAGQENLLVPHRSSKTVSFQTPAAASKKSKTTGRRAFGDISNRKQQQQRPSQSKAEVTKPLQSNKPSIRLERKPSAKTTSAPKPQKAKASSASAAKSTQKVKDEVYESIELPYGLTGSELDELYDSDGHVSVCSMEKEGVLFTRRDTAALFRQGMAERRKQEDEFLTTTWKKAMEDEQAALARNDGTYA